MSSSHFVGDEIGPVVPSFIATLPNGSMIFDVTLKERLVHLIKKYFR